MHGLDFKHNETSQIFLLSQPSLHDEVRMLTVVLRDGIEAKQTHIRDSFALCDCGLLNYDLLMYMHWMRSAPHA